MDTAAVARIRSSFQALTPKADQLMDTFYTKLFETAPGLRSLFPADMKKQKGHLLAAVALVVKNADKLGSLEGPLMDMGERHVKYGAKPEHYPVVGKTMIAALSATAGPLWNSQLEADWSAALGFVASTMIRGAQRATKQAA